MPANPLCVRNSRLFDFGRNVMQASMDARRRCWTRARWAPPRFVFRHSFHMRVIDAFGAEEGIALDVPCVPLMARRGEARNAQIPLPSGTSSCPLSRSISERTVPSGAMMARSKPL